MTAQMSGYSGPERRKQLATLELWQENIKELNRGGLTNCQMRYALAAEQVTFIVRFENEVPSGQFSVIFPELDPQALTTDGWQKLVLTITINDEGRLVIELWGRYERDSVPLDVKLFFERDVGLGVGVAKDTMEATDARNAETIRASFQAILGETMKDGESRYARKGDEVNNVSVEGMLAILGRYLKQLAVSRRMLPS